MEEELIKSVYIESICKIVEYERFMHRKEFTIKNHTGKINQKFRSKMYPHLSRSYKRKLEKEKQKETQLFLSQMTKKEKDLQSEVDMLDEFIYNQVEDVITDISCYMDKKISDMLRINKLK